MRADVDELRVPAPIDHRRAEVGAALDRDRGHEPTAIRGVALTREHTGEVARLPSVVPLALDHDADESLECVSCAWCRHQPVGHGHEVSMILRRHGIDHERFGRGEPAAIGTGDTRRGLRGAAVLRVALPGTSLAGISSHQAPPMVVGARPYGGGMTFRS
jgi:hypothetical protein